MSTAHLDRQIFCGPAAVGQDETINRPTGRLVILNAQIDRVHRDRDFGRVEARISFVVKEPHQPVRLIRLSTNVPARDDAPLRDRLVADAAILLKVRLSSLEAHQRAA